MEENVIIVPISENETFTEWLRNTLKSKISNRNKAIHMSEDMEVANITLHRFLHGREVKGEFYDKAMKYLIKYK